MPLNEADFIAEIGCEGMTPSDPSTVCGTVDRDGRLTSADPRLLALQFGAGGTRDGPLVVPQLASLVRLARTLGVVVSRGVVAADGDVDIELWVRAQPEGDGIRLAIAGWNERPQVERSSAWIASRANDLAELANDGAWSADAALRLKHVEASLAKYLPKGWAGTRLTRVMKLEASDDADLPLLDAVLDQLSFSGQRAEIAGDEDIAIWLHGAPQLDENGSVTGYSGGFRWANAPKHVLEPEEPVGEDDPQFVSRLDAALRKPLAHIIAEADAIGLQDGGALKEEYVGYAADIGVAGRHLLGLVDDLSDLQAVERQGFSVETERLDLADVARRAASLLGVRAADSKVEIDAPQDDEQLWARADFRRALQIMVNLVSNAVRYTPSGGMVWIRGEQEGDLVALIVADQGKGIAADDQERIFEKFERVDPTEPGGSGLGLYISRRLARAMGGDICVDSAPGLGARFVLTLPAAPASPD